MKAKRLRRQTAQQHSDKRKFIVQACLFILLMISLVVADWFFIQWRRQQRYLRHSQRMSLTNSPAHTNQYPIH